MADSLEQRPFDNFRVAITDPIYFFGHQDLLGKIKRSPFQVRIILGGRRIGKTSFLRAVEWNLLKANTNQSSLSPASQSSGVSGQWLEKAFPTFFKLFNPKTPLPSSNKVSTPRVTANNPAFPVFISLQVEQPQDLDNFRYLLIARLREAIYRWQKTPGAELREMYRNFLGQLVEGEITFSFLSAINLKWKVNNSEYEQKLSHEDFRKALLKTINELQQWQFEGVCFLIDSADFIVDEVWANDAWSYLRGLKDTDTAIKPFIGFLLSGYRNLKEYQQSVGSPLLNIAEIDWLTNLTILESKELILHRSHREDIQLNEEQIQLIIKWSGGHPYLMQQIINIIFDNSCQQKSTAIDSLKNELLRLNDHDFSAWWNEPHRPYSLGDVERIVYNNLMHNQQDSIENLVQQTHLSYSEVADSLNLLTGTGIVLKTDDQIYKIGSWLFAEWVAQQNHNSK